ncbi:hypothetical protein [Flavobacterium sp.]|uniref:hypothetical protein n=1 Tax=Flavobacterium sp. TaxID=239 RepID=UPI003528C9DA
MKQPIKLLEIGAEGGAIILYKCLDDRNNDWYYFSTEEMAFDELFVNGIIKKSNYCMTTAEALLKMEHQYNNVWSLHPLYVDESLHDIVLLFLQNYLLQEKNIIDFYTWSNVLNTTETALISKIQIK